MECSKCGIEFDATHTKKDCDDQQEKNAINLAEETGCKWCGVKPGLLGAVCHKETCPKHKRDKSTVTQEDGRTTYESECGYCHAKSTHVSKPADKNGYGGELSFGSQTHKPGCPRYVLVRM